MTVGSITQERFDVYAEVGQRDCTDLTKQEIVLLRQAGPYELHQALGSAITEGNRPMVGYLGAFAMSREEYVPSIPYDLDFGTVWMRADNFLADTPVWGHEPEF